MGTLNPNCATSQHIDTTVLVGDDFELALALASAANKALDAGDHDGWKAARAQYGVEVARWRDLGEALGARTTANVVSHFADGKPDTSTPDGEAYWADVAEAAELGVPNVVGTQR